MKRYDILNWLIRDHGYTSYLEIGIDKPSACHDLVLCDFKVGVDPRVGKTVEPHYYRLTSDAFFAQNKRQFDLVFIDGLHLRDQVIRDVEHSLACLTAGGTIVMHDCHPYNWKVSGPQPIPGSSWYGTVWQAFAYLRHTRPDLIMATVDTDCGCGVIQRGAQEVFPIDVQTWELYEMHQTAMLRLISGEQLAQMFGSRKAA